MRRLQMALLLIVMRQFLVQYLKRLINIQMRVMD